MERKENKSIYEILHKVTTSLLIPACTFLWTELKDVRAEFNNYKEEQNKYHLEMASKMTPRSDFIRLEKKIDDLKDIIIKEIMNKGK